jgi:ubiquinone/menaquinone biosynthesis C-methylase UbiE
MSKQNDQREYWSSNLDTMNIGDSSTAEKFDLNEELEFYFSPEQKYALKKLWGEDGIKGKKILEIGCGMGVFSLFLARQDAEVYVIDVAIDRLIFLKKQAENFGLKDKIKIICTSVERLPFPSEFFDAVYTKSVLIHTHIEEAAFEMNRVLKKDGIGVFVEPLKNNPFANFYRKYFGPKEWKNITKYFDAKRVSRLVHPFEKARVKNYYFISFAAFFWQFGWRKQRMFSFFVKILNSIEEILFKIIPPLKKWAWFAVITVQKKR